jgi:Tfp pilus assembly protein PilF
MIDPLCEEAHLILAMIHHNEGRIEESIAEFQKTIYINIDSIVAHLRLGDIYRGLGQVSAALREYRSALSAMEKRPPNEIVEDLPVELLKQTCEQNIRLLRR